MSETKDEVRIAVIGCGYWGPNWLRNFHQLSASRVVAAADIDEKRLKYVQGLYPGLSVTTDYRELLAVQPSMPSWWRSPRDFTHRLASMRCAPGNMC